MWRYAVRKAKDGELGQAPLAKISIQAQGNLRVAVPDGVTVE